MGRTKEVLSLFSLNIKTPLTKTFHSASSPLNIYALKVSPSGESIKKN